MSLFSRMKLSAFSTPALQAFFGTNFNTFRWFDTQLELGRLAQGTCARLTSVSQITKYLHNGRNPLTEELVQIDVIDPDPEVANAGAAAVANWLDTVNFADNAFLQSPPGARKGPTNFRRNQRGGVFPLTDRAIPVVTQDYRIFNVEPS